MSLYNDMYLEDTDIEKLDNEEHDIDIDPSEEAPTNEYAEYISKNCLNGFLSEDYSEISEKLTRLQLADKFEESAMMDIIKSLSESNLGSELKLHVLESLVDVYKNWNEAEVMVEESVILNEYDNPAKTKLMRELMSEMEKNLALFYDECTFCIGIYADMYKEIIKGKTIKNIEQAHQIVAKVKVLYDKMDSKLTTQEYKDYVKTYNTIFFKLKSICNKFSIKFSDVAMEDKKAFDQKLSKAYDKLYNNADFNFMFPKQDTTNSKIKEINDGLDNIGIYSKSNQTDIVKYIQPVYNWTYQVCGYYFGNINFIRQKLHLEKEDRPFYKILNKILKTKK